MNRYHHKKRRVKISRYKKRWLDWDTHFKKMMSEKWWGNYVLGEFFPPIVQDNASTGSNPVRCARERIENVW